MRSSLTATFFAAVSLATGAAVAAGCSTFSEQDPPATNADGGDGAVADAAGEDALTDARVDGSDADAAALDCAVDNALLCDDFERDAAQGPWSSLVLRNGGALQTSAMPLFHGRSLHASLGGGTSNAQVALSLTSSGAKPPSNVQAHFALYIAPVAVEGPLVIATISSVGSAGPDAAAPGLMSLVYDAATMSLRIQDAAQKGATNATKVPGDAWYDVTVSVFGGASTTGELRVVSFGTAGNDPGVSFVSSAPSAVGLQSIALGVAADGVTAAGMVTVSIDDVVITAPP